MIDTAEHGPRHHHIDGPDRAMGYRVASETGLRRNELRSLTVGSFDLDGSPPTVTVDALDSKHRRTDVLPIRTSLAERLRVYFAGKHPGAPAFQLPKIGTASRIRKDLDLARSAWIKTAKGKVERTARERSGFLMYRDDAGRYLDFHALRHTFITNLARGGVHPKVAMDLARHTKIDMTLGYYTHMAVGDLSAALYVLPDVDATVKRRDAAGG